MKEGEEEKEDEGDKENGLSRRGRRRLYHHLEGIRGKMGLPVPQ